MSKFRCLCGEIITTSGDIPNPDEWLYVSDVEFDRYSGSIQAENLYQAFGQAFLCPKSGHIWLFRDGIDAEPTGYAPIPPDQG
jgi:hypothetical protein